MNEWLCQPQRSHASCQHDLGRVGYEHLQPHSAAAAASQLHTVKPHSGCALVCASSLLQCARVQFWPAVPQCRASCSPCSGPAQRTRGNLIPCGECEIACHTCLHAEATPASTCATPWHFRLPLVGFFSFLLTAHDCLSHVGTMTGQSMRESCS